MIMKTILEAQHINKYFSSPNKIKVLNDINFSINEREFVTVIGKSGCGKSTLLYILSTMDTDHEGSLVIDGEKMDEKKDWELARIRNEKIGFIFQFHYLLNEFTVLRNVMLPGLKLGKFTEKEIEKQALEKLQHFSIFGGLCRRRHSSRRGPLATRRDAQEELALSFLPPPGSRARAVPGSRRGRRPGSLIRSA